MNGLLPLSEHHTTQGCPLQMSKTLSLWKRKVDYCRVALGGSRLFLTCALRDLSTNLGGRKALLSQCSYFFSFVEAWCSQDLCHLSTFPSLKYVFLWLFCVPPPDSVLSLLLAAKWNLLHSCFLSQFKNMIAVHLLVQPTHSKKRGNSKEKSAKLTFSCITVKKKTQKT